MESIFTVEKSQTVTLKPGDKHFQIRDRFMMVDRAGIEISPQCPPAYARLVIDLYNNGWIRPIATVTEREMLFMGLTDE